MEPPIRGDITILFLQKFSAVMLSPRAVSAILKAGLADRHGHRVNVTRGYLTSDGELVGVVKMESFYVALSDGIRPLNSSKLFRKWMESHYGKDILEVGVASIYAVYAQ